MSSAPHDILQEVMGTIERFINLVYRISTSTDRDQARRKLFAKRRNVQSIPPTKAALKEHVKRAVYQGGHVWGQMLVSTPELPSCKWGWSKASEGHYEPFWTCLPDAGQFSYEHISCKHKKGCVKQCKCKKSCLWLHSPLSLWRWLLTSMIVHMFGKLMLSLIGLIWSISKFQVGLMLAFQFCTIWT